MELIRGKCEHGFCNFERGQGFNGCDPGLRRWSAGGGSQGDNIPLPLLQGDPGSIKSLLPELAQEEQTYSPAHLYERSRV